MDLVQQILDGNVRAIARAISLVENGDPQAVPLIKALYPHAGRAYLIGVTGPPGGGKSTLVDKLIAHYRTQEQKVGVVAVDPTSPFSGGALLGDRVRMQAHATDPGVFIRSMGSRGHLGGLAVATADAAAVLDAAGYGVIMLETVGIGQSEVEVASQVDTTLLVTVPGLGDDVQVLKAGTMEIADVFVVNKADRDGVEKCVIEIEQLLGAREMDESTFLPPIVQVIARDNKGITELAGAIEKHRAHLAAGGRLESRRKQRLRNQVHAIIINKLDRWAHARLTDDMEARENLEGMYLRKTDPYAVAEEILKQLALNDDQ